MTLAASAVVHAAATSPSASASDPPCYSRVVNDWICGQYLTDRSGELLDSLVQHVFLTLASVALGLAMAIPLAILARRVRPLESFVLGATTIVYTIPSLALFSLLVVVTGLTPLTVIIGLGLYSLSVLVRNTLAGLRAVPADVVESATGLGYGPGRLLMRIELPLALPVIMAGLRVATVSTVALVTIGSVVSNGGLGDLLADGIRTTFKAQILATSVLCVVLAIVLDLLLVALQRSLTPWTRGRA